MSYSIHAVYMTVLYFACGIVLRVLCIALGRYIQAESEGGRDGGTDYRFYPDLPRERCINCCAIYPGAWTHNNRVQCLMWVLAALIGFFWAALLLLYAFSVLGWFFSKEPAGAWRNR